MAVKLVNLQSSNSILIAVGYEGGFIAVYTVPQNPTAESQATRHPIRIAQIIYLSQPHSQPVLSLDVLPNDGTRFFTSSADAVIAVHQIDLPPDRTIITQVESIFTNTEKLDKEDKNPSLPTSSSFNTQHVDVTPQDQDSTSNIGELSDPLNFAKRPVPSNTNIQSTTSTTKAGGLSALLSREKPQSSTYPRPPSPPKIVAPQAPHKMVNTKHAGQQSLRVRLDGRLLVTGGWDKRVRVYSTKTLKELAVLKWHTEGVYAVDFGEILNAEDIKSSGDANAEGGDDDGQVARRETGLGRLQRQREESMQAKHWVVAGAKDGKVSLWEVF